eukprot:CFRG8491T1
MDSLETFKFAAIIATFCTGLLGIVILPLGKVVGKTKYVAYGNAFGSGVILSAGLIHLLGEGVENLSCTSNYPVGYLMATIGFGIMYFIEDVCLSAFLERYGKTHSIGDLGGVVHQHCYQPVQELGSHSNHSNIIPMTSSHVSKSPSSMNGTEIFKENCMEYNTHGIQETEYIVMESEVESLDYVGSAKLLFVAVGLMIGLSLHSFFAGLSLGFSSNPVSIVGTFVAIVTHKAVSAVVLGQSFISSPLKGWKSAILIIIFASMTPTGIGLGWFLSGSDELTNVISGVVQTFSAGMFIYIGTIILKDTDWENKDSARTAGAIKRFLLWMLGVVVMGIIAIGT